MNKTEYWFLNLVVKHWYPLAALESEDFEGNNASQSHNLSHEKLVKQLYSLFQVHYLTAYIRDRYGDQNPPLLFQPSIEEIEEGLAGIERIYFGLTAQGADIWESISKPDWNRYFIESFKVRRKGKTIRVVEGEIISVKRELVQQCLETQDDMITSHEWDILSPWKATYWKVLPLGHRVRYRYEYRTENSSKSITNWEKRDRESWVKEIGPWYTNPFT